jgi:Bbp16-like protein
MILDGLLTFTGSSNGATGTIANGPQTDAPTTGTQDSSNIIDLGLLGIPTSANGGGARDMGIGDKPSLKLSALVTAAFTGGTSLAVQLQGAPDNGSGAPGSWTVMWASPAAVLEAALVQGAQLANVDVPRVIFEQVLPRFLKMTFVSVGTHTAGSVEAQIVIDRDDQIIGPAGNMSGYQAGITVAN